MDLLPEMTEHVRLARDLRESGFASADLAAMLQSGELQHLRRGAYATRPTSSPEDAHRLLVAATLPMLSSTCIVSHQSGALLHELPWWSDSCSRVHVTRSKPSGGRRDPLVHVHPALLEPCDQVVIDGMPVTSLARTVADCLRTLPYPRAVAVADAALRKGLGREELASQLRRASRRAGVGRARRAAAFADARAEAVGESFSRVLLHELRLPPSDLQVEVHDEDGVLVGRCDFGWSASRTLGEFDGRVKYGRLLREGEEPGDAVFAKKVREDDLRSLGNEVVRWTDADLQSPPALRARLLRAFGRGRR